MTPDEQQRFLKLPAHHLIRIVDTLLWLRAEAVWQERETHRILQARITEMTRDHARQVVRYADALTALERQDHLRATITELSHHGDMTPTAKRVLMNVLDGAE